MELDIEIAENRTVGVEAELPFVSYPDFEYLDGVHFKMGDDGSIREKVLVVDDVPILPLTLHGQRRVIYPSGSIVDRARIRDPERGLGLELITDPYINADIQPAMRRLASMYGHLPTTPRASIHVHVDVADTPWIFVQRIVAWFYYLEAQMYRLSAAGEAHRGAQMYNGVLNDHMYARPISNSIGMLNEVGDFVPLIDHELLLKAKTASEFMAAWGRLDMLHREVRSDHYNSHRLHGINLAAVLRQGTIEFRIWNGAYRFLPLIVDTCVSFVELARRCDPRKMGIEPLLLGERPNAYDMNELCELLKLDIGPLWCTMSSTVDNGWVAGCVEKCKPPHYNAWARRSIATLRYQKLNQFVNNKGKTDTGEDSFTLFSRKGME